MKHTVVYKMRIKIIYSYVEMIHCYRSIYKKCMYSILTSISRSGLKSSNLNLTSSKRIDIERTQSNIIN